MRIINSHDGSTGRITGLGVFARVVAITATIAGGGIMSQGCGCDTGEPTVDGDGDLQCNQCMMYAYKCTGGGAVCAANAPDALQMGCQGSSEFKDCRRNPGDTGDTGATGDCDGWNPGAHISYSAEGVYEIDLELVDSLTSDPSLLLACDSAYYVPQSGGYYALDFIEEDDLAYNLGFQSGDVIISVNGEDLRWPQDYTSALETLEGMESFVVEVRRGISTVSLSYEFVD